MDNSIVGMWKLVAFERTRDDGEVARDDAPTGFLLYTPEGWLAEAFQYTMPDGASGHVQYCGTYEADGEIVYHIPSVHPNPNDVGARLERHVKVDGDRHVLTSGPVRLICDRLR
jgi:hypothetical protein